MVVIVEIMELILLKIRDWIVFSKILHFIELDLNYWALGKFGTNDAMFSYDLSFIYS